jgi:DNA-binding GntR family transcriptional regulator
MPTLKSARATIRSRKTGSSARKRTQQSGEPVIRSDRVRRQIADQIITGILRPGQELDEMRLAKAFKVSRTPVREALRQLAAAQLVELRPHQCAVVSKITPSKMVEMFEVMAELEGFCGRLAARRMTPGEKANLKAVHMSMQPFVSNGDQESYYAMNKVLHEAVYSGSHNRYLADQASALYDRLAPYRAFQLKRPEALRIASEEHDEIIDAITRGDGEMAHRLLANHVSLDNELFSDLITALSTTESLR